MCVCVVWSVTACVCVCVCEPPYAVADLDDGHQHRGVAVLPRLRLLLRAQQARALNQHGHIALGAQILG